MQSFKLDKLLKYLLTAAAICCSISSSNNSLPAVTDPRAFYNMVELVCGEGYYVQEHKIVTDDGYVLTLYRIPTGKTHAKVPPREYHYQRIHAGYHPDFGKCVNESWEQDATGPPVLMSHGLLSSSDGWILQGPHYDLAFILADRGYDVWFTNIRGNFYSKQHKTLKPSQQKFWDFSFHENGLYDMPKTIDYILELRKYSKLTYIGHSMGTTMFFVMASLKPMYNDKIQLFVALTPVGQIRRKSYEQSKLTVLLSVMAFVKAYNMTGVQELLPRTTLLSLVSKIVCTRGSLFQDLCYDAGFAITGYHSKLFLRKRLPLYLSHALGGVSVKTFLHYRQLLDAPFFRAYDHGPEENFRRYQQAEPPEYDLRKVKAPTVFFYSSGDYVSNIKDVTHLKSLLPNVVEDYEYSRYSHVDFLWAHNAKDLIYKKVVELIERFRKQ